MAASLIFSKDKLGLTGVWRGVPTIVKRPARVLAEEQAENLRIHLDKQQQKDRWSYQQPSKRSPRSKKRES